jgi:hypothetical protein
VSGCSIVVVKVKMGILLAMQEHADEMAVDGIAATRVAKGVLVAKAVVGSGKASRFWR